MPLVKGAKVVDDPYVRIDADAPVPETGAVLMPADRFLADAADLARREAPTGVIWPNNKPVSELAAHLDHLALIALHFPTFKDGRAYSQARLLREQYGFRGELRATGQVLRDQFLFMLRAGFDALEINKQADVSHVGEAMRRYSVFYQPTGDGRSTALRARLNGQADHPRVAQPSDTSVR